MLIVEGARTGQAVELDEVKRLLRHTHTSADDGLLQDLIGSQTRRYEAFTGRVMTEIPLRADFECWGASLAIPASPVRAITELAYLDADDVEQTVDQALYSLARTPAGLWAVVYADAFDPPELSDDPLPVRLRFTAGYTAPGEVSSGDDPDLASPEDDRNAIALMVGRIFDDGRAISPKEMREAFGHRRIFR